MLTCPNCGKLHKCAGHYPTDPRSKDMPHSCEHCGKTFKTPLIKKGDKK